MSRKHVSRATSSPRCISTTPWWNTRRQPQLWKFIESGDEEEAFDEKRKIEPGEEIHGLPRATIRVGLQQPDYRPTGSACTKRCTHGNAADIDRLLQKHSALAKQLKKCSTC